MRYVLNVVNTELRCGEYQAK